MQDLDWDENVEAEKDNQARAPLRHPRQPSKVLIFQMRKTPVELAGGIRTRLAPPKSEPVPMPDYEPKPDLVPVPKAMPELENAYVKY